MSKTQTQALTRTAPHAIAATQAELDDLRDTLNDSTRDNTKRAYRDGWSDFAAFCDGIGVDANSADSAAVIRYLQALKNSGKKLSTIQARRAAVSFRFGGRQNQNNPALSPEVAKLMQGIGNQLARKGRAKPEQARPILLDELRTMAAAMPDTLAGLRDRAALLVGWFCAMRRSEIANLDVRDIKFRDDALLVTITASKTTAVTDTDIVTIPRFVDDADIDPAQALRAWLDAAGIGSGAVFVRVDKWGHAGKSRINDRHIDSIVKRAAELAKLDTQASDYRRISGHSLRAGLATELARKGATSWQIRQITRHKSDVMLNRYIREGGAATAATLRMIVRRRPDAAFEAAL